MRPAASASAISAPESAGGSGAATHAQVAPQRWPVGAAGGDVARFAGLDDAVAANRRRGIQAHVRAGGAAAVDEGAAVDEAEAAEAGDA